MHDAQDLLVSSIEEMIVRASKRYVELRCPLESLPPNRGQQTQREMKRTKSSIDRLAHFRASMLSERTPGTALPDLPVVRKRTPVRDELSLAEHLGVKYTTSSAQ